MYKEKTLICSSKCTVLTIRGLVSKCPVMKFTKSTVYVVKMTELIKIKVCAVYLRLCCIFAGVCEFI